MNDRELLELAAKAAGIEVGEWMEIGVHSGFAVDHGIRPNGICWNPLTDDGDALRLAVTLGMRLTMPKYKGFGTSVEHQCWAAAGCAAFDDDVFKQTRRAIVHAAAGVGRGME